MTNTTRGVRQRTDEQDVVKWTEMRMTEGNTLAVVTKEMVNDRGREKGSGRTSLGETEWGRGEREATDNNEKAKELTGRRVRA